MLQNMYQKHRIFVVQYPGPQNIKLQLFQGFGLGRRLATRDKGGYSCVSCPVFILICSCCKNSAQKDWKQELHSGAENQNKSSLLTSFAINSFHRSSGRARSAPAGHTVPARGSLKQELNQQMGVIGCYWMLLGIAAQMSNLPRLHMGSKPCVGDSASGTAHSAAQQCSGKQSGV